MKLKYNINSVGEITDIGYVSSYEFEVKNEPFGVSNYFHWKKDLTIGEWKLRDELFYKYFLIPVELVPNIAHYADFVKETFPELIFDVVLDKQIILVEGINVEVPTSQIKIIPCNCTHWTDEGLQLLDAVIENWNVSYPSKQIDFQVKFESYDEFKAFRDGHVQV